ncbi:rho guanine nucleotide exchange factor 16 [Hemicordylus capensis]|uniref:rho guanine nucleotide exchange factor 16 n=1 Tax=Hemicordylus capensis TaxID=884348 RepID=UPI002304C130|nr:rho guanine nucleotide exchange factor 16 [Hemicordylus capensis]XP_053137126.1 rho guanine nucleotide exchange factor 16 [Hemicordylus capensis]XP_053137127.1 rho guanine nucleotide exchange factor 16 [Hemicordylus capensis]XP_053137130.1 rho guanine nucleotide exchange factor 16 [Hemicordylus capensis]
MSQRHSDSSLTDKTLLLARQLSSDPPLGPGGGSPHRKCGSLAVLDNAAFLGERSPSPTGPRQIVLSTESPAALKVGTQQLIPKGLAECPKAKPPFRHQSFSSGLPGKEAARYDPKRLSAPSISLEGPEEVDSDSGALKRNLRSMSYRAAMKGLRDGEEAEAPKPVSALKPLPEEPSAPGARSPGRNKRTFGRKRVQRHGGSFKDDPRLYQEIRERGLNAISHESDDDLLEVESIPEDSPALDAIIMVKSYRPAHVTWSQLPQVQEAGILEQISPEERKRQEAIFEIITSEFSYMRSLDILVSHFLKSEELRATMSQMDHHHLFSNIADILAVSKSFFEDLEKRHQEHIQISDISDILEDHATNHFNPYIAYCSNEVYQQRTLQKLLTGKPEFKEALKHIEQKLECGGLPLISFLILPMQRVTRLPLLMDTVCQKTQMRSPAYEAATQALKAISKLVKKCNEGAHTMERTEQMFTLQKQLEFGKIKNFPLISTSRWLLKRGELSLADEGGIFRKVSGRGNVYLFVFNDVLIITKKKSEESYVVLNYAMLEHLSVDKMESPEAPSSPPGKPVSSGNLRHLFRITLKKDSEGKQEVIVLAAESLSERARWITALMHREEKQNDLAKKGDLKQVEITRAYLAKQTDEISLQQADVVLVLVREDGWYLGERLRDGEKGWFPQACAQEITSRSAVERNVQRMERLRIETNV